MLSNPIRLAGLFAIAVAGLLIASTSSHAAGRQHCVMAGGEATMITRGLAEFMANAALKNSIKKMEGATAVGPVALKCNEPSPLTYCIAKQRACK